MSSHPPVLRKPVFFSAVAGLAAGALAGWWAGSQHTPAENASSAFFPPARHQASPSPVASPSAGKSAAAPAAASDATVEAPATDSATAAAQIARALRSTNPIKRSLQFHRILELMTPENGQFYLDGWLKYLSENSGQIGEGALFNRRIGEVLGPVVVGNRTGDTSRDKAGTRTWLRDQFLGWMETDPAAARTWLDGLKNEGFREAMIGSWFDATAEQNPSEAIALLRTMPEDLQDRYARQIVSTMSAAKGPEDVSNWISSLAAEGDDNRNALWLHAACDGLMQSFTTTRTTGELAARTFEQHSGQPYADPSWGPAIAGRYASSDPANGLAWALHMAARPEFSSDSSILNAAANGIPADKLATAVASCDAAAPGPPRDMLLARIAERLMESDPPTAASVIGLIQDPSLRPLLP